MKPCYAAALALVGWYLMLPPVVPYTETPATDIARARPTAKWQIIGKFDSAPQCVRQLKQLMIKTQSAYDAIPVNPAQHAVCIESGDGGLMGN